VAQLITGLLLLALGVGVCVRAVGLQVGRPTSPGPGFFPFLGGLTLSILAALLAIQGWRVRGKLDAPTGPLRRPVTLVGGLIAYTALLGTLGFPLATAALGALVLFILDPGNWLAIAGASVLLAALSYVVFKVWLGVDLPAGILAAFP
jgi:putative tricarboxylic transport membrane protein